MNFKKYKVSDFSTVVAGGTPSTSNIEYWDGKVPWITPKDLSNHNERFIDYGERNITALGLKKSSAKMVPKNTVLLTTRAPVGYVAIAKSEVCTNQGFKNLICDETIAHPRFIYYILKKNRKLLENHATGATFKELSGSRLKEIEFSLPPLPIQKRIADILSTYDDLIENNNRRITLLEQAARHLYKEWFVRFKFPGHEEVKVVDGVPKGWERKTLGEVCELKYGKALKTTERVQGKYNVFGSSGIIGTHNEYFVEGPGIIIGRKGNVGSTYWSWRNYHPIDTVYFIDKNKSDFWLYLTLERMPFVNSDVAVPGLNRNYAYSRKLIIPSNNMQSHFVDKVSPLFIQIKTLETNNKKLKVARDLLLPRMVNRQII